MSTLTSSILFVLGIGVFGGMLGALVFQRLHIPQVVGYISIGLVFGSTGLGIISRDTLTALQPFNLFALGIIGFLVGGELKLSTFRTYARQFTAIMLGEGLGAFLLVGLVVSLMMYYLTGNPAAALAAGLVLGAVASATDPASTIDVLWENRSLGVLTTSIIAVVALDDALAMLLYGLGTSMATLLVAGTGSPLRESLLILGELLGSLLLGAVFALVLWGVMRMFHHLEKSLAVAIGLILLMISVCIAGKLDVILAAMMLGFVLTNVAPRRSERLFAVMREFSVCIYALFFVLVGARLHLEAMPSWIWGLVLLYLIGRTAGKVYGARLGARLSGAEPVVQRYLGIGLFTQGGVAIGLSIVASQHLNEISLGVEMPLGDIVISTVAATTFIVQMLGPPLVKMVARLSGEAGRDVTEADVIAGLRVGQVMDTQIEPISEAMPLAQAIQMFSDQEYLIYPVTDTAGHVTGLLSLDLLKSVLPDQSTWQWLVASDVMEPVRETVDCRDALQHALSEMGALDLRQLAVVDHEQQQRFCGLLDEGHTRKRIAAEMLRRRGAAPEGLHPAS